MKKVIAVLCFITIWLSGCEDKIEVLHIQHDQVTRKPSLVWTAAPNPGRPGPYEVCAEFYEYSNPKVVGRLYVPVEDSKNCKVTREFPLVLIAHADGTNVGYDSYEALGQHLASHGFVVASMDRFGLGADEAFDNVLTDQLDYLYTISTVKNVISADVGLIGHSAGGRAVIKFASVINEFGKELKSLIVLAPTVNTSPNFTFNNQTTAFLGLHVTYDTDASAFGDKPADNVMKSTFKVYDDAGIIEGEANNLSLTKDMVFAYSSNHYFQNQQFSLTYINAFLQTHLNQHAIYNRFFKFQEKPAGLSTRVFLQHADPSRLVLADFENKHSQQFNRLGGEVIVSGGSISKLKVGPAYILDDFSPHSSNVVKFDWNKSLPISGNLFTNMDQVGEISFLIPNENEVFKYRYLSFRITQVYHPEKNQQGIDRNIEVVLGAGKVKAGVSIAEHGGLLHFPFTIPAPTGIIQTEQTKNAMRSYLIPLSTFKGINLKELDRVTFDFSPAGATPTTFILDDIEFYR